MTSYETPSVKATQAERSEKSDYDAQNDLGGSIAEGFRAIRERMTAGGPGWERREK